MKTINTRIEDELQQLYTLGYAKINLFIRISLAVQSDLLSMSVGDNQNCAKELRIERIFDVSCDIDIELK